MPPDAKNWLIRKEWRQKEKGVAEDEMVREHHWLNGHQTEQTAGDRGNQEHGVLQPTSQRGRCDLVTEQHLGGGRGLL